MIVSWTVKINKFILNNWIRITPLLFPVIYSTAFGGCSDVAGTAGAHPAVNFQASATGKDPGRNDLTIRPVQTTHRGFTTNKPVELVVFYAGQAGLPININEE